MGFRVQVQGLGFRGLGLRFRVLGFGFRVQGSGCRVQGFGLQPKAAVVMSELKMSSISESESSQESPKTLEPLAFYYLVLSRPAVKCR